ncbi:MAG: hypothetical protein ACRDLB_12015 [Actinomycetota bacterium]
MRHVLLATLLLPVLVMDDPAGGRPLLDCPPWQLGQHLETGTREEVRDIVHGFIRAYNRGDFERLDEIFPQEPGFEGYYAEPERQWEEGEDRSNLMEYFEGRHDLNDRLTLKTLRIQEEREERGWDFYFELRRASDERVGKGRYVGKGVADCAMSVWNMGRPRGKHTASRRAANDRASGSTRSMRP